MVDNVMHQARQLETMDRSGFETQSIKARLGARYGVVTLHRPSNVDSHEALAGIATALNQVAQQIPLVFPVHPRTRANLEKIGQSLHPDIHLMAPQPYMSFLNLWKDATLVLTNSGGLQEETTALGVPCITMRESTERPVTVDEGTNRLAGTDPATIVALALNILCKGGKTGQMPHLGDGRTAKRIVDVLAARMAVGSTAIPRCQRTGAGGQVPSSAGLAAQCIGPGRGHWPRPLGGTHRSWLKWPPKWVIGRRRTTQLD